MKSLFTNSLLFSFLLTAASPAATTVTETDLTTSAIPDGNVSGVSRSLTFNDADQTIVSVEVGFQLSASGGSDAYLGDLYIYLTDGTNLVTLFNRPGQDAGLPGGYDDNQSVGINFADTAVNDFHIYRESVTGDADTPLSGPLTGDFQPDGRITDPTLVATGDTRETALADFVGLSADRTFTLFAADLSGGNTHQIDSWSVTLPTVPEPSALLLCLCGSLGLFMRRRS
jgi:subtilisin-like proprotein convertase family protein